MPAPLGCLPLSGRLAANPGQGHADPSCCRKEHPLWTSELSFEPRPLASSLKCIEKGWPQYAHGRSCLGALMPLVCVPDRYNPNILHWQKKVTELFCTGSCRIARS
jgi:hypothetical protein